MGRLLGRYPAVPFSGFHSRLEEEASTEPSLRPGGPGGTDDTAAGLAGAAVAHRRRGKRAPALNVFQNVANNRVDVLTAEQVGWATTVSITEKQNV